VSANNTYLPPERIEWEFLGHLAEVLIPVTTNRVLAEVNARFRAGGRGLPPKISGTQAARELIAGYFGVGVRHDGGHPRLRVGGGAAA
jgi:hypothetical protein